MKSIKNTAQAIKNRGCTKSTKIGPGPGLGSIFGVLLGVSLMTNVFFSWKSECEKTDRKTGTPKSETRDYGRGPGLPDSPPLKSKIEQQLNNKQQQFNNSTQTLTIAELLLQFDLLFLYFVWFQIQNDVVFVSCWISKSRAMIWHALGKARRIPAACPPPARRTPGPLWVPYGPHK